MGVIFISAASRLSDNDAGLPVVTVKRVAYCVSELRGWGLCLKLAMMIMAQ